MADTFRKSGRFLLITLWSCRDLAEGEAPNVAMQPARILFRVMVATQRFDPSASITRDSLLKTAARFRIARTAEFIKAAPHKNRALNSSPLKRVTSNMPPEPHATSRGVAPTFCDVSRHTLMLV